MEEDLIAYIKAAAGITALIGSNPVRVYWTRAPQNVAKPYMVLTKVSGVRDYHMGGASGLVEARVQADCYATTYAAAKGLARALEVRLSGLKVTQGTTAFRGVFLISEFDTSEDDATPDKLFRTSLDFNVHHKGA